MGFGLDSLIEIGASSLVIRDLAGSKDTNMAAAQTDDERDRAYRH